MFGDDLVSLTSRISTGSLNRPVRYSAATTVYSKAYFAAMRRVSRITYKEVMVEVMRC